MFGYEEGAFTGARRGGKPGLVEAAHTGTLFLDEIGDMPLALQTRLLRVLQEREVLRIGATQVTPVDVRVVAATHADLRALVEQGKFRSDLFYRLAVLRINLPPLRERREDIPSLAESALQRLVSNDSASVLMQRGTEYLLQRAGEYAWPGNVRELHNWLERLLACQPLWAPGGVFHPAQIDSLFAAELQSTVQGPASSDLVPRISVAQTLRSHQQHTEWQRIHDALRASDGRQADACRSLGISRSTLWRRLREMAKAGWASN